MGDGQSMDERELSCQQTNKKENDNNGESRDKNNEKRT